MEAEERLRAIYEPTSPPSPAHNRIGVAPVSPAYSYFRYMSRFKSPTQFEHTLNYAGGTVAGYVSRRRHVRNKNFKNVFTVYKEQASYER